MVTREKPAVWLLKGTSGSLVVLEVLPLSSGVLSAKGSKRDAVDQQASVRCLCPNTMFSYVLCFTGDDR